VRTLSAKRAIAHEYPHSSGANRTHPDTLTA
jgi:hypothetical protein